MDRTRRPFPLRRVAMMAVLAAIVPAGPAEAAKTKAKSPVITKVSPMKVRVGQTLTITGKYFRKGKGRNSVGFKRDGASVVFVKSDVSTTRKIYVVVPSRLQSAVAGKPQRFRLRILAARFGRSYTSAKLSPTISARPAAATSPATGQPAPSSSAPSSPDATAPEADCDNDGTPNGADADDDNDLLPDALENAIGTDGCKADSDGDGITDGYEYKSAVDLNDDDYQSPQSTLPFPGRRPYPNALDASDADVDYDGDGLSDKVEYDLWVYTWNTTKTAARTLEPLSYSAGEQYSVSTRGANGRRQPTLAAAGYAKTTDFLNWATATGYRTVQLDDRAGWTSGTGSFTAGLHSYGLLDADRSGAEDAPEVQQLDLDGDGYLSDNERDEDADGLSNYDETVGRMQPGYWTSCYTNEPAYAVGYAGTSAVDADTDGDGVRDGADDQDHDDVPNIVELSRMAASHLNDTDDGIDSSITGGTKTCTPDEDLDPTLPRHPSRFGKVNPFNPCDPDPSSRTCPKVIGFGTTTGPDWWSLQ